MTDTETLVLAQCSYVQRDTVRGYLCIRKGVKLLGSVSPTALIGCYTYNITYCGDFKMLHAMFSLTNAAFETSLALC